MNAMMERNEAPLPENHPLRRQFLFAGFQVAASLPAFFGRPATAQSERTGHEPFFKTRGVVLTTPDLSTLDWPRRAAQAGLTTIATHITPSEVSKFIQTERGREFLAECRERGIDVEHELHAMSGRQGCNPVGESSAAPATRSGRAVMPHPEMGNYVSRLLTDGHHD